MLIGGRGGPAKIILTHMGGERRLICKRIYAINYFLQVLYKIKIKYEIFRQPKLTIPISPIQLESATSIPRALPSVLGDLGCMLKAYMHVQGEGV